MKKKSSLFVVIVLVFVTVIFYFLIDKYEGEIESISQRLDDQMIQYDNLQSVHIELEQDHKKIQSDLEEALEKTQSEREVFLKDIEAYEYLINLLIGGWDERSMENRFDAIASEAKVTLGDLQFDLPKNGLIITNASTFELIIELDLPPDFRDETIDQLINSYPTMLTRIEYPKADEEEVSPEYFRLYYSDLNVGDSLEIQVPYYLRHVLSLDEHSIKVQITDQFDTGSDYVPSNIHKKVFTGGYENGGYTETYTYLDDHRFIKEVQDTATDMMFEYESKGWFKMTKGSSESSQNFREHDVLILPELIRLGESWQYPDSNQSITVITAIDLIMNTPIGPLKAIEVTTFHDSSPFDTSKCYYTKELGMIYKIYAGYTDQLIDVEFKE